VSTPLMTEVMVDSVRVEPASGELAPLAVARQQMVEAEEVERQAQRQYQEARARRRTVEGELQNLRRLLLVVEDKARLPEMLAREAVCEADVQALRPELAMLDEARKAANATVAQHAYWDMCTAGRIAWVQFRELAHQAMAAPRPVLRAKAKAALPAARLRLVEQIGEGEAAGLEAGERPAWLRER
jgi:hypothetical protein